MCHRLMVRHVLNYVSHKSQLIRNIQLALGQFSVPQRASTEGFYFLAGVA